MRKPRIVCVDPQPACHGCVSRGGARRASPRCGAIRFHDTQLSTRTADTAVAHQSAPGYDARVGTTKRRKLKKSYDIPGHAHFLTYSCHQRLPLLTKDRTRQWVVDELEAARRHHDFCLWAYVVMPEHVHILIRPRTPEYRMADILASLKRNVSKLAKEHLQATKQTVWLKKLEVRRGSRNVFRFWQAGGGYDENIWSDRTLLDVIEYVHANPVRRGLVAQPLEWRWSSAAFWAGESNVPIGMDPIDI